MNLEDKIKRLVELKKITYPSDQEVEEKERLQEELGLEAHETRVLKPEPEQPKKSILRTILRVKPKIPVTQKELDQLKLEAQKAELKARIAKAKAQGPSLFDSITKVIGKSTNNPFDVSSTSEKKDNPFRW